MASSSEVKAALAVVENAIDEDVVDEGTVEDAFSTIKAFVLDALPKPLENQGKKTGLRDKNGKRLRVGDRVQVYGSSRYGDPTGVVTGPGGSSNRVTVKLDSGANDAYTPTVGRVKRVEKAEKPDPEPVAA